MWVQKERRQGALTSCFILINYRMLLLDVEFFLPADSFTPTANLWLSSYFYTVCFSSISHIFWVLLYSSITASLFACCLLLNCKKVIQSTTGFSTSSVGFVLKSWASLNPSYWVSVSSPTELFFSLSQPLSSNYSISCSDRSVLSADLLWGCHNSASWLLKTA